MLILDDVRTAQALPYATLVPAIAQAARELATGKILAPERQVVTIDQASVLLCMPAIGPDIGVTKLITVHAGNARHRLPAIQGEVVAFEAATGRRLALLDGPTVTARRTAAMTLLGIETLAPRRPASALIIGTGTQAAAHVDAMIGHLGIARFWIAGSTRASAERFGSRLKERYRHLAMHPLAAETLERDLPETNLVVALTTSKTPVIPARIAPETLAIGVGAFKPDMAEFPPELLRARRIVVDDLHGARHEAGDLIQANVDWSGVTALGSILAGQAAPPHGVPVFKTVGQAAWDLAAARVAVGNLM
ncbi:MAG TPA: delta(1)-pyrroline-2-carboxylate reductase family protein [Paucimonas sp.]|nr:delta(1)-pyrroline-2-carboxylate reductase family protein [Paucimonas sp.]